VSGGNIPIVGSYSSTKRDRIKHIVTADLPTPPSPRTCILMTLLSIVPSSTILTGYFPWGAEILYFARSVFGSSRFWWGYKVRGYSKSRMKPKATTLIQSAPPTVVVLISVEEKWMKGGEIFYYRWEAAQARLKGRAHLVGQWGVEVVEPLVFHSIE